MSDTLEIQPEEDQMPSRRKMLTALGGVAVAAAAGAVFSKGALAQTPSDADILNFALNLEYLEAEFYTLATTGQTIEAQGIGITGTGTPGGVTVRANPQVNFTTPSIRDFALELAADERAHVRFLRQALGGAAVARPAINLRESFNAAAQAAGIGQTFDPFANETNFLLGTFIFEDVGVTAYKGAARLINNRTFLGAAASILAVEGYHAGSVRRRIIDIGPAAHRPAQLIAELRASVGGGKEQGVVIANRTNVVPNDQNAIAFGRTAAEVLRIVYLGETQQGGFFPNGMNGAIRTA